MRLAAAQLEQLHVEQALQRLHAVADGGLALVQGLGRPGIAAGLDHADQGLPLLD